MLTGNDVIEAFKKNYPDIDYSVIILEFFTPGEKFESGTQMMKTIKPEDCVNPKSETIWLTHPFIFDTRTIPEKFMGFAIEILVDMKTYPPEFNHDLHPLLWDDELWSAERVHNYASDNADSIRQQLNKYDLTIKDICDIMVREDFEKYKITIEEERANRILRTLNSTDNEDDFDFDDFDNDSPEDNIDDINIDDLWKPEK